MIDRLTVEKIKASANIVDVVSEFVTLRKSGANYKGLCPFHNEKTPSFYVSPARGTCHCFGCGKGGNPVNFIMEHEQMTYPEALRWLAKKYHIEVHEKEMTDQEREAQSLRESMFIVNEWACSYFERLLHEHPEGEAYGKAYFHSRGFRDDIIQKFRLGYDATDRLALANDAIKQGYKPEFLLSTGICYRNDHEQLIDRYAGRVVFPWIGVSGKIVGFTARVLDSRTKGVAQKYVNSPASDIYHKDRELYGIWQAKRAIAKEDHVYMVEGQADVVSMHQCGIENVVANSGTALSFAQIQMLHRFTSNITLIYDNDEAGIHAAMKGTDMILSEGMNLKVLMLPDGQDPDEYARTHTAAEFREYIDRNQHDFIKFKTELLLKDETDPQKRLTAINSIVESISHVPNQIMRDTYIQQCSQTVNIHERTLINQMNKFIRERRANKNVTAAPEENVITPETIVATQTMLSPTTPQEQASKVEQMLTQMVIRHGEETIYTNVEDEDGNVYDLTVAQYIHYNLSADELSFKQETCAKILEEAVQQSEIAGFKAETYFLHHDDTNISMLAAKLANNDYHLSERDDDTPSNAEDLEQQKLLHMEKLRNQTEHLLMDFRMDYVEHQLKELMTQIKQSTGQPEKLKQLMEQYRDMQSIRNQLAKHLGINIRP